MTFQIKEQAILASVGTEIGGNAYTHESVEVTITATMKNGSLLIADNTEAAAADAATVVGIIDDALIGDDVTYSTGDVVGTRVARRNVIANKDVLTFSDAAYGSETLTALDAKGVILQSASSTYDYK